MEISVEQIRKQLKPYAYPNYPTTIWKTIDGFLTLTKTSDNKWNWTPESSIKKFITPEDFPKYSTLIYSKEIQKSGFQTRSQAFDFASLFLKGAYNVEISNKMKMEARRDMHYVDNNIQVFFTNSGGNKKMEHLGLSFGNK